MVYVRDLTDEEYEEELKAYEKAKKEWNKTQGAIFVPGAITTIAKFATKTGNWARGQQISDGQWHWIEWELR